MNYITRFANRFDLFLSRIPVLGDVLRRPLGMLSFLIVLLFIIVVIFAPLIAPYHYAEQNISNRLQGPSSPIHTGTDHLGRDLFSRLVYGSRIAMGTAIPSYPSHHVRNHVGIGMGL